MRLTQFGQALHALNIDIICANSSQAKGRVERAHKTLQDRVTALRTANIYERQSYRHIVGLPVIGANPADGIAAETPFLVARIMRDGRTDLFVTGVYLDKIRDEAGSLRFAERLVVCDSSHFDTLLAIPL